MIEIGRTLSFPFQMTCIDSKVRDVIPIPGILADFEINLGEEFWRIAIISCTLCALDEYKQKLYEKSMQD